MQICKAISKAHSKTYRVLTIFLLLLISFSFIPLPIPVSTSTISKAWWNSSWQYYKVCNINTNGYSGYYQMRINVSYSSGGDVSCEGHCQSDFDDIRFVDIDNSTVLPYWKETYVDSQYAIFWVNVSADAMSDGKILMYYGNSGATDASDGDETFIEFASWENSLEGWTDASTGSGEVSFVDSSEITPIHGSYSLKLQGTAGNQGIVELDNLNINGDVRLLYWVATPGDKQRWYTPTFDDSDLRYTLVRADYGEYDGLECTSGTTHITLIDTMTAYKYYRVYVEIDMSANTYNVDINNGAATANNNNFIDTGTSDIFDRIKLTAADSSAAGTLYVDAFCVMKGAVGNEPTWSSFGEEQSVTTNNAPTVSNPYPENDAEISLPLTYFRITVADADGDTMNISWQENSSGVWKTFNTTSNINNGTYYAYNTSWVSEYGKTYWWRVTVDDGTTSTTAIYKFRTAIWMDNRVHRYIIDSNYHWRAIAHTWEGQAVYHNNITFMHHSKSQTNVSAYSGWIVWFNLSNQTGGIYHAISNPASSHTGGDIAIDEDGYLWLVCGGYADTVPIRLYKSNNTLDFRNWTEVATVSQTTGAIAPSVFVNDTFVAVIWRNGANDNSATKIHLRRYWKNNFTLNKDVDIAVGGYSTWTLTNCYTASTFDPQTNETFISWSYKQSSPSELWGSLPFIRTINMGDTFTASNGTDYSDLDDGDGLMEFEELDIPQNGLLEKRWDATGAFCQIGVLPNGSYFFAKPLNIDTLNQGVVRHTCNISFSNGMEWYGYKHIGENIGYGNEFCVFDTKNYFGVVYANGTKIMFTYSSDSGKTWSDPICLINETENITGISVATPATYQDIDNIVRFFYSTTFEEISQENRKNFFSANNDVKFAWFNVNDFVSNTPPTLSNPSATPSSGVADYTVFYFNITYSDPDGDPPVEIKVNISKPGWYINVTMTYVSGDNTTGALYSYSTTLSVGVYDYLFYATDGTYSTVNDPTDQVSVEAQSYSFTVSTADPSGQENFTASATMGAEWNVSASYQTSSIPAIQITNTGNVPINISINLTSAPISNVHIKYNTSSTPPSFTQNPYYCDKELTTTPVTVLTIEVGGTGNIWLWADFENKDNPGSYTTSLYISSSFGG